MELLFFTGVTTWVQLVLHYWCFFILSAVLLVIIIMLQDEQGEGLGGIFGGGSSSAFGSRTGNVLTRFTSILGAIFVIGAFSLAW